jgi:hypothetical protein
MPVCAGSIREARHGVMMVMTLHHTTTWIVSGINDANDEYRNDKGIKRIKFYWCSSCSYISRGIVFLSRSSETPSPPRSYISQSD